MAFRPLCFEVREKVGSGMLSKGCLDELILHGGMMIQQVELQAVIAARAPGDEAATTGSERGAGAGRSTGRDQAPAATLQFEVRHDAHVHW